MTVRFKDLKAGDLALGYSKDTQMPLMSSPSAKRQKGGNCKGADVEPSAKSQKGGKCRGRGKGL